MKAMGSVLTNKYAEGLPSKRYYGGCEVVDQVENYTKSLLKKVFNAEWVNVQPHSGAQANAAVMLGLLNPGDTILGLNLAHGGHLTHGSHVNFSGKIYRSVFYGVDKDTELIDWKSIRDIAYKERPKLIICGASSYSRDWNYAYLRDIADEFGSMLLADIAHPAGLISTKMLNDPFPYCDVITSTTHKTLRGPRGGIIMSGKKFADKIPYAKEKGRSLFKVLDSAVFPGTQGGPLMHIIAAKGISFEEAATEQYTNYMSQVVKNSVSIAKELSNKGYRIVSGGTDNHLLLLDLRLKNITGKEAEDVLGRVSITVNKNMMPFDERSPLVTSGIRIGTPAITTRGFKEKDMLRLANYIDECLSKRDDEKYLSSLKEEINKWASDFPLFQTDDEENS